ncbi:ketopantoate reductase family protein [Halorussus amylolyticus]|uniref:ketopantoate reductase family protein n=1 Tax=Halorussus amylolyticus TaxID=1126242 RepID=UPI0010537C7C|nr:ketopantoate reductase family protein [Halorussus amylolyticus]
MNVVVFGAGSLGSLVGGLLAREHAVTLVGRDPHVAAVRESGLRVGGRFDFEVSPDATTDATGLTADLAVVTVKAFDTETAADALSTGDYRAVLSLQNGMGNEAILAERLDWPVLAGTASYGAVLREPGVVDCTGEGEVVVGPREGGTSAVADDVGRAFRAAGIETTVADDMPRRLWRKLAVNAGINATTALARVENGAVLDGAAREIAMAAARETARVARAEGVELGAEAAVEAVERVASDTAENVSSMHQDVLAGGRTEIEAINGHVAARADRHGVAVPTNRTLANLVRAWEDGRDGDR